MTAEPGRSRDGAAGRSRRHRRADEGDEGGAVARADGRRARSERTRKAVAEAMLDCLESGILQPSARQVAERAGISARGVFRHFDTMENLYEAVVSIQFARVAGKIPPLAVDGSLARRVHALTDRTATLHELIAPVRRAGRLMEPFSEVVSRRQSWLRQQIADEVQLALRGELAQVDESRMTCLQASLRSFFSFSHWEHLRRHGKLSREDTRRMLRMEVLGVLLMSGAIDAEAARTALDAPRAAR